MITFEEIETIVPQNGYSCYDISHEATRTIHMENFSLTIERPVALVIRKGGSTHRVVDATGNTYCYAVPENGKTVISWTGHDGDAGLRF